MSIREVPESTPVADTLVAPVGLNLLGDDSAGACCGGSCSIAE
ncbi:hypothetical protein [Microbacterium sp.]|nr:hypothetical protein [Microbacterium sp.]MDP3949677.1 hypothetical protein [Microbacterium sp.]